MDRARVFETVSSRFEEMILRRELLPGDRLPAERETQEKYGVGRGTVREAYRALEQKGLIEIRKGGGAGAYVKEMDAEAVTDTLALMVRHGRVPLARISEFRHSFDVDIAAYAAMRATPEDIAELRAMCDQAEGYIARGEERSMDFYRLDLALHVRLAAMTDNPLYEWVSGMVYKNAEKYAALLIEEEDAPRWALDDWWAMAVALEKRDVMQARAIAQAHGTRSDLATFRGAEKSGRMDLLDGPAEGD